jgi:hypothetical protein
MAAPDVAWDDQQHFVHFIAPGRYVSTHKKCESVYAEAHDIFDRTAGSYDIRMMHEYVSDDVLMERGSNTQSSGLKGIHSSGRERLDNLLAAADIINERKFSLSERQMTILHDTYFVASLQKVFGDELPANIDYIMKTFEIEELFEDVIIMMQRRGGKTVVTSAYVIAFAMTQLSGNINVYGKSKRVTKMMKELVKEIYFTLKESKRFEPTRIVEDNDERFSVETRYGTVNVCNFYPCNSEVHSFCFLFCMSVKCVVG